MIFVPTESASSVEMVTVDPLDLQVAQERDSWHLIFQPEPTDQRSVLCDFRAKRYRLDRFAVTHAAASANNIPLPRSIEIKNS
jgi:hypothetical protein